MAAVSSCPSVDDLKRLVRSPLAGPELETLARHLERCERCVRTVHDLGADDTLSEALQKLDTLSLDAEASVVEGLAARLRGLWPAGAPSGDATSAGPFRSVAFAAPAKADRLDFLAPAESADEIGRLGPYRVLKALGAGGMGIVFLAEDTQLRRRIALKVLKPDLSASAEYRRRFLREARAAAALDHDHIVTIYQVSEAGGIPSLAMQLLQGESLEDRLQREGKLPLAEGLRIGREIAEGLAAAHERGLVHRDIKPGNVWLEAGSGRVKILDFGLSRPVQGDGQLTEPGAVLGTPAYMAPEQADGAAPEPRCDLFSLGCVMYRMATGEPPFKGKSAMALLKALATVQPPAPHTVNPDVPRPLHSIAFSPDGKRLATAGQDNAVRVWDASSGELVRALPGHFVGKVLSAGYDYVSLAWSPNGKRLAVGGGGGGGFRTSTTVRLWEVETGRAFDLPRHAPAYCLAWSPDGKTLAWGGIDGAVYLWDPATPAGPFEKLTEHKQPVRALSWSPDGQLLASSSTGHPHGGGGRMICLWGPKTGKLRRKLAGLRDAADSGITLAFTPDGKSLLFVDEKTTVLWDVAGWKKIRDLKPATISKRLPGGQITWLKGGKEFACATGIWEVESGECVFSPKEWESIPFPAASWAPDGETYASGLGTETVRIQKKRLGELVHEMRGHPALTTHMPIGPAFSPGGKRLATVLTGGGAEVWDSTSGQFQRFVPGHPVQCHVRWSRDGKTLWVASVNVGGALVDFAVDKVSGGNSLSMGFAGAVSPNGKLLARSMYDSGKVELLDAGNFKVKHTLPTPTAPVYQYELVFSPDGKLLATGATNVGNGEAKVWEVATGKELHTLPGAVSWVPPVWSPDGKAVSWGKALYSAETGKALVELEEGSNVLGWLADGKQVLAFDAGYKLGYWDAQTGKLLKKAPEKVPAVTATPNLARVAGSFGPCAALVSETATSKPLAVLVALRDEKWLAVGADGHYRGAPRVEREIVYVVQTDKGQETLTPEEFAKKYGWTNEPDRVRLTAAAQQATPEFIAPKKD